MIPAISSLNHNQIFVTVNDGHSINRFLFSWNFGLRHTFKIDRFAWIKFHLKFSYRNSHNEWKAVIISVEKYWKASTLYVNQSDIRHLGGEWRQLQSREKIRTHLEWMNEWEIVSIIFVTKWVWINETKWFRVVCNPNKYIQMKPNSFVKDSSLFFIALSFVVKCTNYILIRKRDNIFWWWKIDFQMRILVNTICSVRQKQQCKNKMFTHAVRLTVSHRHATRSTAFNKFRLRWMDHIWHSFNIVCIFANALIIQFNTNMHFCCLLE